MISKIQFISQNPHLENIKKALNSGCNWIQLRVKDKSENEVLNLAYEVKLLCKKYNAKLIINDFVNIVNIVDADGVHLGLNDMNILNARKIIGYKKIIGGTANTIQDVLLRIDEKVDYIGLGPLRYTTTKQNLSPILNLNGYKKIDEYLKKNNINIPIIAIGGIIKDDIVELKKYNIYGVAFSNMLIQSKNPKKIINYLNEIFN